MSWLRANSSPDLLPPPPTIPDDLTFEGLVVNAKLLLKLIQDHQGEARGGRKGEDGGERREKRVAGMMAIMDDMRVKVEKSQIAGKKREAELRRCNTDLRREKKGGEEVAAAAGTGGEEKQKMRKELSMAMGVKKNLEMLCSSMGKEKEIMAAELARKAQELVGMEELVGDLRAQNDNLLAKVRSCVGDGGLQERNKALSDQLLKALDGYRVLKRRVKELQAENLQLREEVQRFRGRDGSDGSMGDVSGLEKKIEEFHVKEIKTNNSGGGGDGACRIR